MRGGGTDPRRWFLPLFSIIPPAVWLPTGGALLLLGVAACGAFARLARQQGSGGARTQWPALAR